MEQWSPSSTLPAHICPLRRHHPNEQCRCFQRLDVHVPLGHSRAADGGDVHATRLQNLRWRLGACQGAKVQDLPLSLRALPKDHAGAAAASSLRPLSPPLAARPALVKTSASERQLRGGRRVSFDSDLVAEVPHFIPWSGPGASAQSRRRRVGPKRGASAVIRDRNFVSCSSCFSGDRQQVRQALARNCSECCEFFCTPPEILHAPRSPGDGSERSSRPNFNGDAEHDYEAVAARKRLPPYARQALAAPRPVAPASLPSYARRAFAVPRSGAPGIAPRGWTSER